MSKRKIKEIVARYFYLKGKRKLSDKNGRQWGKLELVNLIYCKQQLLPWFILRII